MNKQTDSSRDKRSRELRKQIVRILQHARRGHLGASFSMIEIFRVLYDDVLKYDSNDPDWMERDRFVLSKGHGCLTQYVMLADKGFINEDELWKFCKFDSILGGHPEHHIPGVEVSTGSLGHGLSMGVGFALAARIDKKAYRVFVVLGDGEINEGSVWEAAMSAGKHGLENLVAIIDYNKHQSYGPTREVQDLEPLADKWRSFGFGVVQIDGHSVSQLKEAFARVPLEPGKPSAIICDTIKGKGYSLAENNLEWHHKNKVTDEEIAAIMQELDDE